jgi:peptidyl-prolyl cis-trans isomerase C
MHAMPRLWGAALALTLTGLPALAQTPPSGAPASSAPTTPPATPPAKTLPTPTPVVSPTAIAATVNGEPIYELAVQRGLESVPPSRRDQARPDLITYLVDNLLLEQYLKSSGVAVEKAEVDKRVEEMRAELKKNGKDFDKMLIDLKVSEVELRQHITAEIRWYKYATGQATDKVLRDLFAANKDMFDGTTVRARHILISPSANDPKAEAATVAALQGVKKQIETQVEAGLARLPATTDQLTREKTRASLLVEVFAAEAKKSSECPTKERGGDVGWFQKAGFMSPPFANASFALQPGQMSDLVRTPFGYHLILVTERKPGREVKFEEVKEMVKEVYCDRLREGLAQQVRARAKVVIHPAPK